jgi:hypothetical protein
MLYVYLPRLKGPAVLAEAVRDGLGLILWRQESFAYADSHDEVAERYRGLRGGEHVGISDGQVSGLLVRPEVASRQLAAEIPTASTSTGAGKPAGALRTAAAADRPVAGVATPAPQAMPKRYHGTVVLDTTRVGRDAGRIADEVISHLAGLVGSNVRVTLEIEAEIPAGVPDQVVRVVTENSRTLKFMSHGFESE